MQRRPVEPVVYVNGQLFRDGLHKPVPPRKQVPLRIVPAFTIQSLQKNTVVQKPPRANPRQPRKQRRTQFQILYERGDLPIGLHFGSVGLTLLWKVQVNKLDYQQYLPIFFEGLRETKHPYHYFATKGITDMLEFCPEKILNCIPQLILPIKNSLDTRNKKVIQSTLKALQQLVKCDENVGESLVPYYRQILPVCNLFFNDRDKNNERIDGSSSLIHLGKLIEATLNVLEIYGGEDAFINIKYMVPGYESCIYN